MTNHIHPGQLALFAHGDLGFWSRRRIEKHVGSCTDCLSAVNEFQQLSEKLSESALVLPPELNAAAWNSLAGEMSANIRLGIAAGECVSKRRPLITRPRLAVAMAGLAALVILAGVERPKVQNTERLLAQGQELEASSSGIEVHSGGHVLAVPAPAGRDVIRTVNTRGDMRSRYVDDTGVTIVDVYAYGE